MNTIEIAHRINHPTITSSSEITSLKELTIKYPYSQVFSILYLKSLANENSFNFEEELPHHAYKISDRNKLFELIHSVELQENNIDTLVTESIPVSEELEIIHLNELVSTENRPQEEEYTSPIITQEEIITLPEEPKATELDIDILSNVISNVFSEEFDIEEKEKSEIISKINENQPTIDLPKPFSSWLKANKSKKSEAKADHIINQFIQDEPSITKPTKEFYSPIKQGQKSIDASNIIYSETLANILAIQGNYPKAILAYEQLILTIPEKKIYFVEKIKELKEKLNS